MRLGCKNLLHDTPDLIKILVANENAQKLEMNKEKITLFKFLTTEV